MSDQVISIHNASENNLRDLSLQIPKNQLVVITGVSGSGKSSLVFDVVFREAERAYLSTFTSYARQFLQRTKRPDVERITGLSPAIAIDQHSITRNPRSTVGTLTEIYDYLRLLYARVGVQDTTNEIQDPVNKSRSLFSFNSPEGACPVCKGLGVEDSLDPELLIADPEKSIREGAFVITASNGYIIYSQVTLDVLNQVCEAEGFSIDIPWKELTPSQRAVILYGSDKIEVPFGKHTLESRMRWSGITAKPREMGYYKGIIPVMETILSRERNKNILRFVRTRPCHACEGQRLKPEALSVTIQGLNIADLNAMPIGQLKATLSKWILHGIREKIARPILEALLRRIQTLEELGLDYLSCSRASTTLSAGESQRIRLAVQLENTLQEVLYIFDEPSVGLHPSDSLRIINALKRLRDKGNSVIVVEHEEAFILHADHLIDIGPGAGSQGGEVIVNCPVNQLNTLSEETIAKSATLQYLFRRTGGQANQWSHDILRPANSNSPARGINSPETTPWRDQQQKAVVKQGSRPGVTNTIAQVFGASLNNLRAIDVAFHLRALNVVTGVSGAGKSSLVMGVIAQRLQGTYQQMTGWEVIGNTITIDQSPIGKTSRSNPATYTGLFDLIRALFAALPASVERGYGKSRFSFNTRGGRCTSCEGAGYHQLGMHFMGTVEVPCETCHGKQFDEETLAVTTQGKSIAGVLAMTIAEAIEFFPDNPKILHYLQVMDALGLGYLHLGQRSSTLSGGEAQRIKLATELARPASAHTLYLLDEPTTGLHNADVTRLLEALKSLVTQGHTVIIIEHHPTLILGADHVVDLGPGSGKRGGTVVASGTPLEIMNTPGSLTGKHLSIQHSTIKPTHFTASSPIPHPEPTILLSNISTNNLKNLSCNIPRNRITVITGISGSGKSSLAFDTIFAEGQNRFLQSFSAYARTQIGIKEKPDADKITGLTPVFAVDQKNQGNNPRSTIGTFTGIHDILRLFFARFATNQTLHYSAQRVANNEPLISSLFSFNDKSGACQVCDGLGTLLTCDPDKLITHPAKPLVEGAMDGTKTGRFYGEPFGQYTSTLKAVGERHQMDFTLPWNLLPERAKKVAMEGTGDETYDVVWKFARGERTGEHRFKGKWIGFAGLVNEEYTRKHADHRGEEMKKLLKRTTCQACDGQRLNKEALAYRVGNYSIADLTRLPVSQVLTLLPALKQSLLADQETLQEGRKEAADLLLREISNRLRVIEEMGLGYLSPDRPLETLSGGEFQRIKLAGQISSGLTGITYVLDEPTAGLHAVDTRRLIHKINELRDEGNTMILVEHDPDVIREADYVIDLGPGAGAEGGEIIAAGTPDQIKINPRSITGKILVRERLMVTTRNRKLHPGISIVKASRFNLKKIDVDIPLGGIIAITGVSGSGKSTLMNEVLLASLESGSPQGCQAIEGRHRIDEVMPVYQKRHFDDKRGTPITYTGMFDHVRSLFNQSDEAKKRGFKKNHFSFLSADGRCETCNGSGEHRVSMDFMADVKIRCETCHGSRYKPEILSCDIRGKNIADILTMSVKEAEAFFREDQHLIPVLSMLTDIGLGYLKLGQPLNALSGGEAQRLTLSKVLLTPRSGNKLFLLEEPSLGLHSTDLPALITLFDKLADQGHTLIMIEHNPEMILHADWIIDLGPGPGDEGGRVMASGDIKNIIASSTSLTGTYLRSLLK